MIYKNILIPTDGSKAYEDIVEFICSIYPVIQAQIHVAYMLEVPRNLPLDADLPDKSSFARAVLDKAVKTGEKYQAPVSTSVVFTRSAEDAVISTAGELKCDLIVIVQDNHKLGFFGDAAAAIYQKAKCNVWLFNNKL
ncbi:MAG: universal stress protein [Firmicutes bacterium]|nr:universal stress protein [Bacillota bacterium]